MTKLKNPNWAKKKKTEIKQSPNYKKNLNATKLYFSNCDSSYSDGSYSDSSDRSSNRDIFQ